ncbi:MAG: hypothetical protein JO273_05445 [Methylobacteriaceae bacterium]|nr:hypothetical protein [Methylobacteriaceae bacterium]
MRNACKRIVAAALAGLTLVGTLGVSSTPASAQYCRWHYCGGYRHHGVGAGALIGGLAAGAIIGGALAAQGASCWRHDWYGRPYRVC